MFTHGQRSPLAIVTLIVPLLLLLILLAGYASASDQNLERQIVQREVESLLVQDRLEFQATTKDAIEKLAPELREMAQDHSSERAFVTVLMKTGTKWQPYLEDGLARKPFGDLQWVSGYASGLDLVKLAGLPGVYSIASPQSLAPALPPEDENVPIRVQYREPALDLGLMEPGFEDREALRALTDGLTPEQFQARLRSDPAFKSEFERLAGFAVDPLLDAERFTAASPADAAPATVKVKDIHGASAAWAKGYMGEGVVVGVVDTGVDFGHPDLQDAWAAVPSGAYEDWPFAYHTRSGYLYALAGLANNPDNPWSRNALRYVETRPVELTSSNGVTATADLTVDAFWSATFSYVFPDTSKSGNYLYSIHPDLNLWVATYYLYWFYGMGENAFMDPPAILLVDENTPGVYDTVYVDIDFDLDFTNETPLRIDNPVGSKDISGDGVADLSAGILSWISDGINPPPGTNVLFENVPVPAHGELIAFVGEPYFQSHGTNVAGNVAARGVITDPLGIGPINPIFGGGAAGPVLSGMAPAAKIAAFQEGFLLPWDSWMLGALGFDGVPGSGDEVQISNNSWGASGIINDGWDHAYSRFAQWLNHNYAPNMAILASTGNGGHGFGTVASPDGGTIIGIGASTQYGTLLYFEPITDTDMLTYGDVQPWSNRGPDGLGGTGVHVNAVGAWGTGPNPLNLWAIFYGAPAGNFAYDIFGGTSMASPIAAGNLALIYQAYKDTHGNWPTYTQAKTLLMNSADDLGYDVLVQGAGNVNSDRGTDIAAGLGSFMVSPPEWLAGNYRGNNYPAFPAIMHPGSSSSQAFTVANPAGTALAVALTDSTLTRVHEVTYTVEITDTTIPDFLEWNWITDITALVDDHDPDLVRAQVVFPYDVFDSTGNYSWNNRWRVAFWNWKDINENGVIDTSPWEYNRFTYGYPSGTFLEASVGRDSLSRRHDGVLFGLQRRSGSDPVTLQVRITFYKKADWDWLTLDKSNLTVAAGGSDTFMATMNVPAAARPGVYEGGIYASGTVIPVVVHVAANSSTFAFGAESLEEPVGNRPYSNGHLFGGFDWTWRYEAGDWRFFYFDVPDGTAGPGKALLVDTQWNYPQPPTVTGYTDVDTWVYGPSSDFYSHSDPAFFGPTGIELVAGSNDTYIGDGKFTFDTATGGPREVVGGELRDGLGMIALHNVLHAGVQLGEPIVGQAYEVFAAPSPVYIESSNVVSINPVQFGESWEQTFSSTYTITEGITVSAYGLSQPQSWLGEHLPVGPTLCDWEYAFSVSNGGLIEAFSSSSEVNDLDLYLYRGATLIASSTSPDSSEEIKIKLPVDGSYKLCVDNWSETPGAFDLFLRVPQGQDLVVTGVPTGTINANTPITFTVAFTEALEIDTRWEGVIFIGPLSAPSALEIPVTIDVVAPDVLLDVEKTASHSSVKTGDVFTYTITVTNEGADREYIELVDSLPPLVEFVPGSQTASKGTAFINLITRQLSWSGWLDGGETLTITFQVKASSGTGTALNTVSVGGIVTQQQVYDSAGTYVNVTFEIYLPLIFK
jgi:uncharacterized repeat protein (TIGR01451 family)